MAELDHDHATAWFGDSKGFCERLGVIHGVSKAIGDGHNIKAIGFKGQIEGHRPLRSSDTGGFCGPRPAFPQKNL